MTDDNHRTKRRKPCWKEVVLVISLGLNILVIGLIAGAFLREGKPIGFRPDRNIAALGLRPYYRALDKKDRVELRKSARAQQGGFRSGAKVMRAALLVVADRLEAEPFDLGAVKAELTSQADVIAGNISFGHKLLLEQISGMTREERKKMADNLRRPPRQSGAKKALRPNTKPLN